MKNYLFIASIFVLFLSLQAHKPVPTDVKPELKKLHFIIERSHIDSVKVQFRKIMEATGLPSTSLQLPDGTYHGESPYDDFDYKHVVDFNVKNGKITQLDYDEIHKDGHGKQADKAYCKKMSAAGTTPAIAYPVYENTLLEKQNLEELDAVSGASYSLYRFKLAVAYAIVNGPL